MASKRLLDKVAIVTGGASGFGKGIVAKFHHEGARVVIADINFEGAAAAAAGLGSPAQAIRLDAADPKSWTECRDFISREHGKLDIVVNNAGTSYTNKPTDTVTEEDFDLVMNVNVKSLWASTSILLPWLLGAKAEACFIQIASTSGIRPRKGLAWYGASKGAVITATKALASEYGPSGIRFNAVSPFLAMTASTSKFLGIEATPEIVRQFTDTSHVPLGRPSTPGDVANACCYLASDEASFITGVNLEVDGGRCV